MVLDSMQASLTKRRASRVGQAAVGFDDESDKAHKCVHLVAQKDRLVPAVLLLRADLKSGRQSGQKSGNEDAGALGAGLGR